MTDPHRHGHGALALSPSHIDGLPNADVRTDDPRQLHMRHTRGTAIAVLLESAKRRATRADMLSSSRCSHDVVQVSNPSTGATLKSGTSSSDESEGPGGHWHGHWQPPGVETVVSGTTPMDPRGEAQVIRLMFMTAGTGTLTRQ
jgi:hypothetical protein